MQAVIIIHGMGEQLPMATLNGFVDAVWTHDDEQTNLNKPNPTTGEPRAQDGTELNISWSKPDTFSGSFELRRVTTESSRTGKRIDFFEFYWAHHVEGTSPGQLLSWIGSLLFRNPRTQVPGKLSAVWYMLWAVSLLVLMSLAYPLLTDWIDLGFPKWAQFGLVGFGAVAWFLITKFLVKNLGDVARYVKAKPYNVHIRQKIRQEGVQLIETILDKKKANGSHEYSDLSIVAHSLGTIVAYDVLTHAFARRNTHHGKKASLKPEPKRAELEAMLRQEIDDKNPFDLSKYRELQDSARAELVANGTRWVVKDFITLGSPLTHAEFLLAKDVDHLEVLKSKRVFPTCPPILEHDLITKKLHFTYRQGGVTASYLSQNSSNQNERDILEERLETPRSPHHAALFAYTRWTNIYSAPSKLVYGDLISGEVAPVFGVTRPDGQFISGIKDIPVLNRQGSENEGRPLTHTKYWNLKIRSGPNDNGPVPHHITELRNALRLDS